MQNPAPRIDEPRRGLVDFLGLEDGGSFGHRRQIRTSQANRASSISWLCLQCMSWSAGAPVPKTGTRSTMAATPATRSPNPPFLQWPRPRFPGWPGPPIPPHCGPRHRLSGLW